MRGLQGYWHVNFGFHRKLGTRYHFSICPYTGWAKSMEPLWDKLVFARWLHVSAPTILAYPVFLPHPYPPTSMLTLSSSLRLTFSERTVQWSILPTQRFRLQSRLTLLPSLETPRRNRSLKCCQVIRDSPTFSFLEISPFISNAVTANTN